MVSPRIWVSCAVGENAQQGMPLAQRLISDLRDAGAEVVSESATLPDEQFLPFLQQELASCQWFILVQTPQGMRSRRAQLAIQEALSCLKRGSLRGACLVSASSDGWDEPVQVPEIRSYTYNGDYLRLRDKLLLDLDLVRLTSLLEGGIGETTMKRIPPSSVQKILSLHQQVTEGAERLAPFTESTKRLAPSQRHSREMYEAPSSFQVSSLFGSLRQMVSTASQHAHETTPGDRPVPSLFGSLRQMVSTASQHAHETTPGDRPVPQRFTLPMSSRRFKLYGLVSILSVLLIVSGIVLAKGVTPKPSLVVHPTPMTFSRPASINCGPAISDNFQGDIDPGWTWVNPTNQASYRVTTAGTLSITAPPLTDLNSGRNEQAPRLLQSIHGNFTLETQVEVPAKTPTSFWAIGLVIWQDQGNFFRVELNTKTIDFEQDLNGIFSHDASNALAAATIHTPQTELKIQRTDTTYSAYYSLPGQSWQLINTVNAPFQNLQAGLDLVNVGSSQFTAYFHSFSVTCN